MADYDGQFYCLCPDSGSAAAATVTSGLATNTIVDTTNDDLGVDIDCITDINPNLTLASGKKNLANAVARRLLTDRSWLRDVTGDLDEKAGEYGEPILAGLNSSYSVAELEQIEGKVKDQCEKDERIKSADVSAVFVLATSSLTITINLEIASGPFSLILKVSALTVEILDGEGEVVASG